MIRNILKADFKRVFRQRQLTIVLIYVVIVAAIYCFSQDGSWVSVNASSDGVKFWGFYPDPTQQGIFYENGYSVYDAIAAASVAHTVFFPIFAIVFIHQFFFKDTKDYLAEVSFARGISRSRYLLSKLIVISIVLQVSYFVVSFAVGLIYFFQLHPDSFAQFFGALIQKAFWNSVISESFIVFCMGLYALLRNGISATMIIFVVTFGGMILQMSLPELDIPLHLAYWMKISGMDNSSSILFSTCLFSVTSFLLFYLISYYGITKTRRN